MPVKWSRYTRVGCDQHRHWPPWTSPGFLQVPNTRWVISRKPRSLMLNSLDFSMGPPEWSPPLTRAIASNLVEIQICISLEPYEPFAFYRKAMFRFAWVIHHFRSHLCNFFGLIFVHCFKMRILINKKSITMLFWRIKCSRILRLTRQFFRFSEISSETFELLCFDLKWLTLAFW